MPKLTIANARRKAAELGCSLRKTQADDFRVCLVGYPESYACYESDLQSALDTAAAQAIWLRKYGKLSVAKTLAPYGYIIITQRECGKCWEVDSFVRQVFSTYDEAKSFLSSHAPSTKTFKICALGKIAGDQSLEDMEQEARREDTKGE